MNFIKKIMYFYECVFYQEELCFICGNKFCLYDKDKDIIPACSKGCIMEGLNNEEKRKERENFKENHGENWKKEYIKFLIDNPQK
jgi:hypothetical protein